MAAFWSVSAPNFIHPMNVRHSGMCQSSATWLPGPGPSRFPLPLGPFQQYLLRQIHLQNIGPCFVAHHQFLGNGRLLAGPSLFLESGNTGDCLHSSCTSPPQVAIVTNTGPMAFERVQAFEEVFHARKVTVVKVWVGYCGGGIICAESDVRGECRCQDHPSEWIPGGFAQLSQK